MPEPRIAVIGAGLAGLACARALMAAGRSVRLFDKGRAPGGRLATRRAQAAGRTLQFDHGAQYLTARGPSFAAALATTKTRPWPDPGRLVGMPGMSALPRALAADLAPVLDRLVVEVHHAGDGWHLRHTDPKDPEGPAEREGPFEALLLTIPAPQAIALLPVNPAAVPLQAVRFDPCWTLLAAFPARLDLPDTLRPDGGPIGWAARDSAKPGRDAASECWVVQATATWSTAQLEYPAPAVITELLKALATAAGAALPKPDYAAAHRWRYAAVSHPLGVPCLWDPGRRLGFAGDWCLDARAEAAFDSGEALAAAIIG